MALWIASRSLCSDSAERADPSARSNDGYGPCSHSPSWPGLSRPSTFCLLNLSKDVDTRDERGYDGG